MLCQVTSLQSLQVTVSPTLGVPPVNMSKGQTLTFAAAFATSNYHITATNPVGEKSLQNHYHKKVSGSSECIK